MIKIDRHIEILLLSNDCVIVPGLGGFMAHHIPAKYYADSQSFIPPQRQLGFNAQLQINDSLLAQSYIEAYDISYPEALKRIASEVAELNQTLQNHGECELHGLGKLTQSLDGHIEFVPCEAGILSPELYGLNTVDIPMLEPAAGQKAAKTVGEETSMPKPVPHLASSATAAAEDVVQDEKDYEEPRITIKLSTLRHVATSAAVVILLFVCALPFGKLYQPKQQQSYADTGILFNILPNNIKAEKNDSTPQDIAFHNKGAEEQILLENIAKADEKTAEKTETEKKPDAREEGHAKDIKATEKETQKTKGTTGTETPASRHFYSIVIASQVAKANAEEFVKTLHGKGLDKAEVLERDNARKVIYGRFKTKGEAYKYLNNIRSKDTIFEDGWVMEFKTSEEA